MSLVLLVGDGLAALLVAVLLALDLAGARITRHPRRVVPRRSGQRLAWAGTCLACGIVFLTGLARYRHWSSRVYDGMLVYLMPLMCVALVLIVAGAVVQLMARRTCGAPGQGTGP